MKSAEKSIKFTKRCSKLKFIGRVLMILSGISIAFNFFLPLWRIDLMAPQYPEGLGLYIYVNRIEGVKQEDLKNINTLNKSLYWYEAATPHRGYVGIHGISCNFGRHVCPRYTIRLTMPTIFVLNMVYDYGNFRSPWII